MGDLKARVEAVTGLSAAAQMLASGGTPLSDDGLSLSEAGVVSGGGLALSVPLTDGGATLAALGVPDGADVGASAASAASAEALEAAAAAAYVVQVKLPPSLQPAHGASLTLATSASATVDEVAAQLATLTGMSAAEQQLSFGAVPLINGSQALGSHKPKPPAPGVAVALVLTPHLALTVRRHSPHRASAAARRLS